VVIVAAAACAREAMTPFRLLDQDNNGRITQQEADGDSALAAIFNEVDLNDDGELTAREYLAAANRYPQMANAANR
jgi:Ca2+-binding EF-hand superfamily protein